MSLPDVLATVLLGLAAVSLVVWLAGKIER